MTQELEKSWAGQVLTPEELKDYAQFEQGLKTRFTENDKQHYEASWTKIVKDIEEHLKEDPASAFGQALGKRCMDWVNVLYGKNYVRLRTAIWNKGFKQGHAAEEHGLSPESVEWLDKAIDAYYRGRIYGVLSQVEAQPQAVVLKAWNELLADMYGEEQSQKDELIQEALKDKQVSPAAKNWLKKQA